MVQKKNVRLESYQSIKSIIMAKTKKVTITLTEKLNKIDKETKDSWLEEVEQCHWLYNKETDYFVKGRLKESGENVVFVRTLDNGWFSLKQMEVL
jgi:hypothetical protein